MRVSRFRVSCNFVNSVSWLFHEKFFCENRFVAEAVNRRNQKARKYIYICKHTVSISAKHYETRIVWSEL